MNNPGSPSSRQGSYFNRLIGIISPKAALVHRPNIIRPRARAPKRYQLKPIIPSAFVFENQFSENRGCCVYLDETVTNSIITLDRNSFVSNLFDVFCRLKFNTCQTTIKNNEFKMGPHSTEKSIKVVKRIQNLKIFDNRFSRVASAGGEGRWARFFGCIKSEERGIEDMEEKFIQTRRPEQRDGLSSIMEEKNKKKKDLVVDGVSHRNTD